MNRESKDPKLKKIMVRVNVDLYNKIESFRAWLSAESGGEVTLCEASRRLMLRGFKANELDRVET